jgi:hypothetical protein
MPPSVTLWSEVVPNQISAFASEADIQVTILSAWF